MSLNELQELPVDVETECNRSFLLHYDKNKPSFGQLHLVNGKYEDQHFKADDSSLYWPM